MRAVFQKTNRFFSSNVFRMFLLVNPYISIYAYNFTHISNYIEPNPSTKITFMYFKKEEIIDKITQISQERHTHDKAFTELQTLINQNKKYEITQLRTKFTTILQQLQHIIKQNQNTVDLLVYRCQKLSKQGVELNNQKIRLQSLKEYFQELKEKLKRENQRGEDIITGRERWELVKYQSSPSTTQDEEQSLLNSHQSAKQTTEVARQVLQSLSNQGNRLEKARQQMGSVLKNINFAGNLTQLMKRRTKEDNKLIAGLSFGLVVWILFCLFVIKPWYRGN